MVNYDEEIFTREDTFAKEIGNAATETSKAGITQSANIRVFKKGDNEIFAVASNEEGVNELQSLAPRGAVVRGNAFDYRRIEFVQMHQPKDFTPSQSQTIRPPQSATEKEAYYAQYIDDQDRAEAADWARGHVKSIKTTSQTEKESSQFDDYPEEIDAEQQRILDEHDARDAQYIGTSVKTSSQTEKEASKPSTKPPPKGIANVLFTGSRKFRSAKEEQEAKAEIAKYLTANPTASVIHGGAIGVDTWVGEIAAKLGMDVKEMQPDYEKYGKPAPLRRNEQMIAELSRRTGSKEVVAIWDQFSTGTKYTMNKARKAGLDVKNPLMKSRGSPKKLPNMGKMDLKKKMGTERYNKMMGIGAANAATPLSGSKDLSTDDQNTLRRQMGTEAYNDMMGFQPQIPPMAKAVAPTSRVATTAPPTIPSTLKALPPVSMIRDMLVDKTVAGNIRDISSEKDLYNYMKRLHQFSGRKEDLGMKGKVSYAGFQAAFGDMNQDDIQIMNDALSTKAGLSGQPTVFEDFEATKGENEDEDLFSSLMSTSWNKHADYQRYLMRDFMGDMVAKTKKLGFGLSAGGNTEEFFEDMVRAGLGYHMNDDPDQAFRFYEFKDVKEEFLSLTGDVKGERLRKSYREWQEEQADLNEETMNALKKGSSRLPEMYLYLGADEKGKDQFQTLGDPMLPLDHKELTQDQNDARRTKIGILRDNVTTTREILRGIPRDTLNINDEALNEDSLALERAAITEDENLMDRVFGKKPHGYVEGEGFTMRNVSGRRPYEEKMKSFYDILDEKRENAKRKRKARSAYSSMAESREDIESLLNWQEKGGLFEFHPNTLALGSRLNQKTTKAKRQKMMDEVGVDQDTFILSDIEAYQYMQAGSQEEFEELQASKAMNKLKAEVFKKSKGKSLKRDMTYGTHLDPGEVDDIELFPMGESYIAAEMKASKVQSERKGDNVDVVLVRQRREDSKNTEEARARLGFPDAVEEFQSGIAGEFQQKQADGEAPAVEVPKVPKEEPPKTTEQRVIPPTNEKTDVWITRLQDRIGKLEMAMEELKSQINILNKQR